MIINLGFTRIRLGKDRTIQKAGLGDLMGARGDSGAWGTGNEWAPQNYGNYYATSTPAYRAIKLRADAVAGARLIVYQRRAGGKAIPVPENHPTQQILDRVNNWWTASDLWKATETYLSLWGSAYWFIERNGSQVIGLWPIRPDRMRIVTGGGDAPTQYIKGYLYQGNRLLRLDVKDVVWFRYFNPMDEYAGLAPVAPVRLSLDMSRDALTFNRNFFRNGAMPQDLVFSVNGPVTEDQVNDFYLRWDKRHGGANNSHRPMLWDLAQGAKPERLGLNQRDMEFMGGLNYTVEEAARAWGVPPPKLYSQTQSIYNNVKQADQEFYTDTISTEWEFLASEVTEILIPLIAPGEDLFCEFDTSTVLPLHEALAAQKVADLAEVAAGTMTINEYRDKYGREPVEWGDVWWKPFALTATSDEEAEGGDPFADTAPAEESPKTMAWKEKALTSFERRLRNADAEFTALQRSLFRDQVRQTVINLHQHKSAKQVDDAIFNQEEWNIVFEGRGTALIGRIMILSAQAQGQEFALGAFDSSRVAVQAWITDRAKFWAQRVNLETAQLLMEELAAARAAGESIPVIQQRVEKVFRFNDAVRSERIARTETLAASNQGHLAMYEQSGVVDSKQWLATMDERVRQAHAAAHRQVVPMGSKFIVGGDLMDGPGLGGSAANVVNCRCTVIPVIRRRSLLAPMQTALHETEARTNGHKPKAIIRRITRDAEGFPIQVIETEENQDAD